MCRKHSSANIIAKQEQRQRVEPITLLSYVLVKSLYPGVVPEQIQTLAVALPQEFDPWRQDSSIRSILRVLSTHRLQQQAACKIRVISFKSPTSVKLVLSYLGSKLHII